MRRGRPKGFVFDHGRVRKAYVYCGEGAGHRSTLSAVAALKETLQDVEVEQLSTSELLGTDWQTDCIVFCMPGGADLPYCRHLNGEGNTLIRGYVQGGGVYLGLCAGAYYACSRVEFEPGTPLEVEGTRELCFFPGLAKGAVYPGFEYQTEAGTRAALLRFKSAHGSEWQQCFDYSNGGPAFLPEEDGEIAILAEYADGKGIAAVRCQVGDGVAVLCGTHPELAPSWLEPACSPAAVHEAHPQLSPADITRLVCTAEMARKALCESAPKRKRFWQTIIAAAGLPCHHAEPALT